MNPKLMVRLLQEKTRARGHRGIPLISVVCQTAKVMVDLLEECNQGISVSREDYRDDLCVAVAANVPKWTIIDMLKDHSPLRCPGETGKHALTAAACTGNTALARLMLNKGADVNTESELFGVALHAAANGGHQAMVKLLLEKGADVEVKHKAKKVTALYLAARAGHDGVVRVLLEGGARIQAENCSFRTALHEAVAYGGHEAVVRLLLDYGANIEAGDESGGTVLHRAAEAGVREAVLRLLIERGVAIDKQDGPGGLRRIGLQAKTASI
jgi:ankyrin repeat protein